MRGLLLLTLLLMVSGLVGKGVVCSRRRGHDDAVGRRRSRFGVSKCLIPGVQEAIGKPLDKFPFGSSGELFRCFFKFSVEGLKHLQLGIVLLHTVACELVAASKMETGCCIVVEVGSGDRSGWAIWAPSVAAAVEIAWRGEDG